MKIDHRDKKVNLISLIERFRSDERCRAYLEELRWPDGPECPRCGCRSISVVHGRNQYDCNSCRYQFSVTSGTIFHDTHLPLWKWFLTVYMMVEGKKGVSANQIKQMLNVSYKTAWYLCHRIRAAVRNAYPVPLRGIVEIDETYVGGTVRGRRQGYKGNKAVVVGAVQRGGKIVLQVIPNNDRKSIHAFVKRHTADETKAYYTDEAHVYEGIADHNTRHERIKHSEKEWVRGDIHTNAVENVWSLLKRSIIGSYHKVSIKHLDAYLDELEWRFNNRGNPMLFEDTMRQLLKGEHIEYKKLTA